MNVIAKVINARANHGQRRSLGWAMLVTAACAFMGFLLLQRCWRAKPGVVAIHISEDLGNFFALIYGFEMVPYFEADGEAKQFKPVDY